MRSEYNIRDEYIREKQMINCDLLLGLCFIFIMTAAGAVCSLFISEQKHNSVACGFSAGVMVAASFWSLLLPAKEGAENIKISAFLPLTAGVALGFFAILGVDALMVALLLPVAKNKSGRMFIAVTVHNVPEGMAVGAAYGVVAGAALSSGAVLKGLGGFELERFAPAFGVAFGIGVQNLPEGFATALSMKSYSVASSKDSAKSSAKAVFLGVLSGAVEPVSGLIGALLAFKFAYFAPWLLAFSAGAMLYVCSRDLIPDSCREFGGITAFALGFCLMTALDVALD